MKLPLWMKVVGPVVKGPGGLVFNVKLRWWAVPWLALRALLRRR